MITPDPNKEHKIRDHMIDEVLTYLEKPVGYPQLNDQEYRWTVATHLAQTYIEPEEGIPHLLAHTKERMILLAKDYIEKNPCKIGAFRSPGEAGAVGAWETIVDGRLGPVVIAASYTEAIDKLVAMKSAD